MKNKIRNTVRIGTATVALALTSATFARDRKATIRGVILIAACLLFEPVHSHAIEGLKLSVQCSNVVLSWPCRDDGSETFIVQYRQTLDPSTPWQTLTTSHYAEFGTNVTYYIHSNVVQNPNCGGGGSFAAMAESGSGDMSGKAFSFFDWGVPLAMRADGTGSIVPLALYPPGFEFSDFLIFDPATSEWLKGTGYVKEVGTVDGPLDPGPMDGDGGGGTNDPPETGFYRVVRVGPNLIGITNGMTLSGVVQIPVEVASPEGTLVTVTLTENGSPVGEDSIHVSPFELPVPLVTLDTTRMSNGVHEVAAIARWQIGGSTNEETGGFFEADCPSVSIVVSNEISFPNWMPYFGQLDNTLLISAQSAHTDTDWWIDIYGANAGYIGTFAGHTFDGTIYGWWDLVGPPPNFIQYTNEPWFEFKVSTPYADPPIKTYKQTDPWPSPGGWVIVAQHAFDNILDHESLYEEIDGFIGLAQGSGYTVRPNPQDGHAYALRFRETGADGDWATFRQALFHPLSRNLVYFGHGGPNGLGYDQSNTNRSILASEIAARLATIPKGLTNRHGYRMVILDGCSTAAGTLPESFGIIHKQNVPSIDYVNASMRFSAFAGWSADKWVGFLNGSAPNYGHIHFIQWIQYYLAQGYTIKAAKDAAAGMPDVTFVNTGELKIFGCWDLTFWGHNN
ncbi:MAG: hypothetical protein BWX84_02750 [Verrucomicrobia bacterium ADurb.Bin118]|jgi:hypothetical protein|nr:hypothetical protein [Verrucomicrobiota bacterium]OQB88831.1 MAG: hypothetical protein BWX84_02750 [Verrucomicrobia bacterium ADurb.Bin118]